MTAAAKIVAGVDRHPGVALAAVCLALAATAVVKGSAKPFAHDEIITLIISGLPTIRMLWTAQLTAADLAPPLNSIVTHGVTAVLGVGRNSARLPALAGYLLMTVIVFEIVRRRSNTLVGLSAALLPSFSGAAQYAYEARGYGMMLGLFALALFSWSEAAKGRARRYHLPLLAFALAGGIWAHYYALLAFVPIVTGEAFRFARSRQFDWGTSAAVGAAGIAVLPLFPLSQAAATRATGYWALRHGMGEDLANGVRFVAGSLLGRRALLLFALVAAAVIAGRIARAPRRSVVRDLPAHEVAAGVASVLIPLWGVLLGVWVTDVFVARYVLAGVVGFAVAGPLIVWRASRTRMAEIVLCAGLATAFTYSTLNTLFLARPRFRNPLELRPLLTEQLAGGEAVIVTDTLFLEAWYYTPPGLRRRLTYVADPATAVRLGGTDTADLNYLALRNWSPMDVEDWDTFVAANHTFRAYTSGPRHWQIANLRERGATLREIGHESGYWLYDVRLPLRGRAAN